MMYKLDIQFHLIYFDCCQVEIKTCKKKFNILNKPFVSSHLTCMQRELLTTAERTMLSSVIEFRARLVDTTSKQYLDGNRVT